MKDINSGSMCEHCCYSAATRGRVLPEPLAEGIYLATRHFIVVLEDALPACFPAKTTSVAVDARRGPESSFNSLRNLPKRSRVSVVSKIALAASDWVYMSGQLLSMFATFVGGIVYGLFALCMMVFPSMAGKSPEQMQAEQEAYERKRKEEQSRWEADRDAYFEQRVEEDECAREAELKEWDARRNAHNRDIDKINALGVKPVIAGADLDEDDRKVKELNGATRAVENGTESEDNLRKMRNELHDFRVQARERDEKRQEHLDAFRSHKTDAENLSRDAHKKMAEAREYYMQQDFKKAEDKRYEAKALDKRAQSKFYAADDAWQKYLSV